MEASDPGVPVLRQHFDRHRTELSRTELVVAEYLLGLPVDILIFRSAEEIASETGTSDATVIRTARRLGFSGLPELKRFCSRPMAKSVPTTERLSQRLRATGDDLTTIASQMFTTAHEVLNSTQETLETDSVNHAISLLERADTVWCLGMGRSEVEARHCSIALSRVGLRTRQSGASGFALANELIDLRAGDVVILFHTARDTAELKLIVNQVTQVGCDVVLVCGVQLRDRYRDKVSAVLTCVGAATGLASWTIGAIVATDILAYGLATRHKEKALATRARLANLRAQIPE
ncbi:MurR/RpiR family transcriptional regulator [Rhizobium sp. BK251]|uniref:MurR/RpiR family transcriptional regulator n=1 Tax=Rhizobium sp. BK251 TaxID=2512125 RepID=UPI001044B27C|nr:MurR/RpiR family transcriptional regulator [Rhizobium sp. BK251]TCL71268.1 RpiR family transcriptional regulator [Rhizobium sp. BK251]